MVMAAMVVAAVTVNAATYTWQASSGRLFDGNGSETANRYAGTGYLFDAASVSQAAILTAFASETGVTATLGSALATGTFSSGRASKSATFTGADSAFTAYFVVLGTDASGNDAIYISDSIAANYTAVGTGTVNFGNQNDYSSVGFKDAAAGFSSAGWYSSASAVPEPTSGLLLLLGVAGLALKRKRA